MGSVVNSLLPSIACRDTNIPSDQYQIMLLAGGETCVTACEQLARGRCMKVERPAQSNPRPLYRQSNASNATTSRITNCTMWCRPIGVNDKDELTHVMQASLDAAPSNCMPPHRKSVRGLAVTLTFDL